MAQRAPGDGRRTVKGGAGSDGDFLGDQSLFEDVDADEHAARRELLEHLLDAGASPGMLKDATRERRLATLPIEFALKGEPRYTLTDVAHAARLEPRYLRAVWLSLGHPNPPPRRRVFTDDDLEIARILRHFLDAGLSREDVLDITRVLGQSVARTAAVIREVVGSALIAPGDTEAELALRYADAATDLIPLAGSVLGYELAVHLREQVTYDVITRQEREAGRLDGTREAAVCFADLSQFTSLGESIPLHRVAAIGGRMADIATETAGEGVELVKTIGDGALFVAADVDPLLDAACALRERVRGEGEDFPRLRVGISFGQAVVRSGDWFGPAVNRASRIVDVAKPDTIVAEKDAKDRAGDRFDWTRRALKKGLKGVGRVSLYRLST